MKLIFSFFIALGMMFGTVQEAEAKTTVRTTVHKVCTVQKQYVPAHYNRSGHWIRRHYKNVTVCKNVPRTVIHKTHRHSRQHYHNHNHGVRFTIKL